MKQILARLMLAFMLVWLPLQGYAAQSMHACQKHQAHVQQMEHAAHEACHAHPGLHAQSHVKANLVCDDCSSCHLIAQPAMLASPLLLGIDAVKIPQPTYSVTFLLFFPEQPQRPPHAFYS